MGVTTFYYDQNIASVAQQYIWDGHKILPGHGDFQHKIPAAIPVLLDTADTSSMSKFEEKGPNRSSVMSIGTPSNETLVVQVPIYSACSCTDFVVSTLPAGFFASSSLFNTMSHKALDFLSKIFGHIWRLY